MPRAKELPGFVAGYWTRSEDGGDGLAMIIVESEDIARQAASRISSGEVAVSDGASFESVEVREVVEHA